ncbi:MAG: NEW3 domain-containing protein [Lachnospiraceae bacterium]|nr:NEW3 domain-containing protein [Lachnospiraceae bacterium]
MDLTNVTLSSSAPTDWEVSFSESTIDTIEAGASVEVTASVTPCEDSITGDYETDITVSTDETSDTAAFRVSVKTSSTWGFVAIAIIIVLVVILGVIFRKFGRR